MMNHINSPNHPSHWLCKNSFFKVMRTFKISHYKLKNLRERDREGMGETERKRDIGILHV